MIRIMQHWILGVVILLSSMAVSAQHFITHAVKKGETLTSLAKHYKVSVESIISNNSELQQGGTLQLNSMLVIPLPDGKTAFELAEEIKEPIGFTKHKVRRKETLFGITKRYHITEADLKKYNPSLYSVKLKKGMQLKIPKFKRIAPSDKIVEPVLTTYIVKPKETPWSIAYTHGISLDSLKLLNPDLGSILPLGAVLHVPILAGSTVENQDVMLFQSYTVPPKMTYFSLGQQFGVTEEQVKELNPEVKERGLQEGMVIRLPKAKPVTEIINTDNYIFYEVKPKQTEFSLTRQLGLTYAEMLLLNPSLEQGLKAGMILKLPKDHTGDFEVKDALVLDKINLLDSIDRTHRPKIMFLLPFRIDKIDFNNSKQAKETLMGRIDINASLGIYSGALIALDSIKELGVSVDVKTFDSQNNITKVKEILSTESLMGYSAIVGPIDAVSLNEVASRASVFNVPVVAPFATKSKVSLSNVFYSNPTQEVLQQRMLNYASANYTDENIIVIADKANKPTEKIIQERFPQMKSLSLKGDLSLNIYQFTKSLVKNKVNWVFLETANFKVVSSVVSILNSKRTKDLKIKLFTTDKNSAFENEVINSSHLSQLNFTYPSANKEVGTTSFSKRYEKRFGAEPNKFATRGFDLTFDLLLKLAYKSTLLQTAGTVGETKYTGNKFDYQHTSYEGYSNTASYVLEFSEMRIKEVEKQP